MRQDQFDQFYTRTIASIISDSKYDYLVFQQLVTNLNDTEAIRRNRRGDAVLHRWGLGGGGGRGHAIEWEKDEE